MQVTRAILNPVFARTAEEGSRALVHAVSQGPESHGKYMSNCRVGRVAPLMTSAAGHETQTRVWKELSEKLEGIQPGILSNL